MRALVLLGAGGLESHRCVPDLETYFDRARSGGGPARRAAGYLPGDIVARDLGRGILCIGIISDRKSVGGPSLVVHVIGTGAREDDPVQVHDHRAIPAAGTPLPAQSYRPPGRYSATLTARSVDSG